MGEKVNQKVKKKKKNFLILTWHVISISCQSEQVSWISPIEHFYQYPLPNTLLEKNLGSCLPKIMLNLKWLSIACKNLPKKIN